MLSVGDRAPAFSLPDQDGKVHSLGDYAGRWVLLYFYPKDNTPGCTKEACAIRDAWSDFGRLGAAVLGVSKDSVTSHRGFADKHRLPFTLLSDEGREMIAAYGAWQKKKMAGREYMGIVRMSYLVDPEGRIAKVYPKVKPEGHALEVLRDLMELQG